MLLVAAPLFSQRAKTLFIWHSAVDIDWIKVEQICRAELRDGRRRRRRRARRETSLQASAACWLWLSVYIKVAVVLFLKGVYP